MKKERELDHFVPRFEKKGIVLDDVLEFMDMYGMTFHEARDQILYFEVDGHKIGKKQTSAKEKPPTRREAAHEYFKKRFYDPNQYGLQPNSNPRRG